MRTLALLFIITLFGTTGFSQTKLISHRSHGGKNQTFSIMASGNFGLPPSKRDSTAKKQDATKKTILPITKKKYKRKSTPLAKK